MEREREGEEERERERERERREREGEREVGNPNVQWSLIIIVTDPGKRYHLVQKFELALAVPREST